MIIKHNCIQNTLFDIIEEEILVQSSQIERFSGKTLQIFFKLPVNSYIIYCVVVQELQAAAENIAELKTKLKRVEVNLEDANKCKNLSAEQNACMC